MPLYLVRWQDLSAAFVAAADEDELIDTLDEIANPDGATWSEYDGPLHIEFQVPAKWHVEEDTSKPDDSPLQPSQLIVDDVTEVEIGELSATAQNGGETGYEMVEEIYRKAFPHLHAVLYRDLESPPDPDVIREATRQELMRQVSASWRRRGVERRDDHVGRVAATMDTSPRWVETELRRRAAVEKPPPKPKPRGQGKRGSRKHRT